MREDLIQSAVSFLTDPKVQSAALTKKVSFLESKGMTAEEIEEAMSRASGMAPTAAATAAAPPTFHTSEASKYATVGSAHPGAPPLVPARPSYDWRDLFIAAVLAGGASYGLWMLAKRVFGPWFKVPSQDQLAEDKEALETQFQAVEESLKEIKGQTEEALTSVSTQSDKVNDSLNSLEAVLEDLKKGDDERKAEFKHVKDEVDALKELVPKMMDRNKEAQNAVLDDLQNELKSLKSLIASRRSATPEQASGSDISAEHGLSPRLPATVNASNGMTAGIPAWQMAGGKSADTQAAVSPSSSSTAPAAEAAQDRQT